VLFLLVWRSVYTCGQRVTYRDISDKEFSIRMGCALFNTNKLNFIDSKRNLLVSYTLLFKKFLGTTPLPHLQKVTVGKKISTML